MMKRYIVKPTLCIIAGVAGTGKTTLGTLLTKSLIDSAFITKDLVQNPFTDKERSGELYERISLPTFKILLNFADIQLRNGKTAIIDGPFSFNHKRTDDRKYWVESFRKIADKHHARLAIVRCLPPSHEELRKRLENRGYPRDLWKLQNWEAFLEREPSKFPIKHHDVYEITTEKEPHILVEKILRYLNAKQFVYSIKVPYKLIKNRKQGLMARITKFITVVFLAAR